MTVYYEDITVGMSASSSHTVTERDIQLFGEATGDMNPVHFDEEYARKTVFRGRVAHGVLTLGFMSAVMGNDLPGAGSIFMSSTTQFKGPVRIGDGTWIGTNVSIMPNVTIGRNCVIGANSVVTSDIPDFNVAAGAPARILRAVDATPGKSPASKS